MAQAAMQLKCCGLGCYPLTFLVWIKLGQTFPFGWWFVDYYWLRRWQRLNFMPCIIIVYGRCVVCKCKMCWKIRSQQYGQACSSSAALQALQIKTSQFKKQDSSHSTSDFLMSHTGQVTTWWAAAKMAAKGFFLAHHFNCCKPWVVVESWPVIYIEDKLYWGQEPTLIG